jgi:hypothetical protein
MKRSSSNTDRRRSYHADYALVLIMQNLLQHYTNEELLKSIIQSGEAQPADIDNEEEKMRKHKRHLDKEKVRVLNKSIFPAMANLLFFFKCISEYPQLERVFKNDIMDLLGIRREDPQNQLPGFIFLDLLRFILKVDTGSTDVLSKEKAYQDKDYRLHLNHLLQIMVSKKVRKSLGEVFNNVHAEAVVKDDFIRVWAWTKMLADSVDLEVEDEEIPHRIFEMMIYANNKFVVPP